MNDLIEQLRADAHIPGVAPATALQAANEIEILWATRDAVLRYARERQAYGSRGTVGSWRIASDLLRILGEPWDEPTSADAAPDVPGFEGTQEALDTLTTRDGES